MYEQESVYIINEIIKVCLIVYVQNEVHFNTIIWEKNLSLIFLSYLSEISSILFIFITIKDVYQKADSKFIKYFEYFSIQIDSKKY